MIQRILLLLLVVVCTLSVSAQDKKIGYGFRAGLSYSKFNGPSETDPNGKELESFTNDKGFHIGASFSYKFTDLVGLRAEFMYSQRGSNLNYEGPSYYVVGRDFFPYTLKGTRKQQLNVNNTFIDIPVMLYYKFGKLEIFGGINSGLLIGSSGAGSVRIENVTNGTLTPNPYLALTLDYNFKKDKAGGASVEQTEFQVNGLTFMEPSRLGAYYEFESRDKMQYKTLDFGLVGGASLYFNQGLFVSFRYIYGLGDVDRNDYDISLQTLNSDNTHVYRADNNRSLSMQFSVGFSF